MAETYYDVLGVDPDATRDEIRAAYRERALETHPDHNDAPDAAAQFKRVSTARAVLTDGTERARYDRLGHDAYVRLGERTTDSADGTGGDSSGGSTDSSGRSTTESTTSGRDGHRTGSAAGRTRSGTGRTRADDASGADWTRSHHARQRAKRGCKRARRRANGRWPFGSERTRSKRSAAGAPSGHAASDSASGTRYAVHDWDGDIDLEWDGQPLDQPTAVTIGCIWLLYPMLIASSLSAAFPLPVNAIVGLCTLGIVGYLLTRPRVAAAVFGFWALVLPLGMGLVDAVSPFSIVGVAATGFVWVPFGYAVALWWALRP